MTNHYTIGEKLGEGSFGEVRRAVHKLTHEVRALKIIYKDRFESKDSPKILKEIKILKKLDHPNIVKIYEYFENLNYFFIVMEYLGGGELFEMIVKKKRLSE